MVKRFILIALVLASFLTVLTSCGADKRGGEYFTRNIKEREDAFLKAEALFPQPKPNNFLARKMLVKYVERQDMPSHLFYIYIVADTGNILGYYVAQAAPVNINAFLSPTEKVVDAWDTTLILTAPSLDGVYYGGAGATSAGDGWFFFDAATDALIIIRGFKFFVSDYPLNLDAKPITVKVK